MTRFASATALLAAMILFSGPASAAAWATGTITVGRFSYTLVDLDPNDGITPSLEFIPVAGGWTSSAGVTGTYDSAAGWNAIHDHGTGTHTLGVSHTNADNGISTRAYIGSRSRPETHFIQLFANTTRDGTPSSATATGSTGYFDFRLSPATLLTFDIPVRTSGSVAPPPGVEQDVRTIAIITLRPDDQRGYSLYSDASNRGSGPLSFDVLEILTASYANEGDVAVEGALYMQAFIYANSSGTPIPQIPEPGALPMLFVGLALLGWRRKGEPSTEKRRPL